MEVKEGAVLLSLVTGALGPAAGKKSFQEGGVNEVRWQLEGAQEMGFALAQGQGGETADFSRTTHIYV